jgi:uncharacterized protein YndB with AHSA1/START domain
MAQANELKTGAPPELVIARSFAAPRALVFKAWSSAEHIKRWFSPECYNVPEATVDFRPGGVFDVCMRSPEGQDFWSRGEFIEIAPPDRLAFRTGLAVGAEQKFNANTTVTFRDEGVGTRITVRQTYEIFDPAFLFAIEGAPEGWRTTLDKLEREVARIKTAENRSVVHASFTLERVYDSTPAQVFHALTDKAAKARWFSGGEGYEIVEREMDVRPGGRECVKGRWASGVTTHFEAVYFDVIANERLVYAYEMHYDERKLSVSLATVELTPVGAGTRLSITEQGAYLDGLDDGSRKRGTAFLLDRLGASLKG